MLFLVPCLLLFFLVSPAHRGWLRRPQPYIAFLIVPLLYVGVLYWNAHNNWWTFKHLLFLAKKSREPLCGGLATSSDRRHCWSALLPLLERSLPPLRASRWKRTRAGGSAADSSPVWACRAGAFLPDVLQSEGAGELACVRMAKPDDPVGRMADRLGGRSRRSAFRAFGLVGLRRSARRFSHSRGSLASPACSHRRFTFL